jgi:hypothetical protein
MKKMFFAKLKEKLRKRGDAVKSKVRPYAEFLASGRLGGILAMILLFSQFDIMSLFGLPFPKPVTMIMSAAFGIVFAEILRLLVRLLFGGGNRSKIYFFITWMLVGAAGVLVVYRPFSPLIMSFLLVLAVDVLGRCVAAFIRQRKFKQIFGYAAGGIALAAMVLYGIFFRTDSFGESRISFYLNAAPAVPAEAASGFDRYLENGTFEVAELSYGNSDDSDIKTEAIDISQLATLEERGFFEMILALGSDYDFSETPIKGVIYLPTGKTSCPTLVIVHGNHAADEPSYLGYDYLGRYLASNGYVVVSVDESICNDLGVMNDSRAILLLENIKAILGENNNASSPLYGAIDPRRLAIAGHSRGGESVATAYLFNELDAYPEDGNLKFDYHFDISAVIAIAPTVDQYMPASHAVKISDVNYLLIHGANDQDVIRNMGEKQYNNVTFTGGGDRLFRKASVYIMGANHGQFNTEWGRYDLMPTLKGYLNTNHFITAGEQQMIAKAYFRTFLDTSLGTDSTYSGLLSDNSAYLSYLPKTVYVTDYMDSAFESAYAFDRSVNILSGDVAGTTIDCEGMKRWTFKPDIYGAGGEGENYVLDCEWEKDSAPAVVFGFDADMTSGGISFRIADMREENADDPSGLSYTVELTDAAGRTLGAESPVYIYPTLAVQLYKQDVLFGVYEYKHQMQSVRLTQNMFASDTDFDFGQITSMKIIFDGSADGEIIMDNIGIYH